MIVKCHTRCWDGKRARRYYPGDQDDIDRKEPIAMYFDFPPGTEVYHKVRGTKTTPAKSTTRIVPGAVAKPPEAPAEEPRQEPPPEVAPRSRRGKAEE